MSGLRAACRALHHSFHSFVLGAMVMVGSHKRASKMSSPANFVQPQSYVVTGPSLSSFFHESTLAIRLAFPFLAVPASALSDSRAAGSMCHGHPQCLKQAVATREPLCALGEHLGCSGSRAGWAVWPGKESPVFRSCSPCLQLGWVRCQRAGD